ncbi:MAG: type II toxin-antitoxin system Phd/YefM family antitoxin [Oscillospiraceae bacterium]|nr:type II toxin-antitoxin system Phd/YefM family antitoxin [Oscillospiraceae bacterium]
MINVNILSSLIPITQFNKGQAAKIFERVKTEGQLVVLKNNAPSAVILSPAEYERLSEIEENYRLLTLADSRLKNGLSHAISEEAAAKMLGLSSLDIQNVEESVR